MLGPDDTDTLISRGNLAKAYRAAGQLDRAVRSWSRHSRLQGKGRVRPSLYPHVRATPGRGLRRRRTARQGQALLRDSLERAVKRFGSADPRTAGPMASLGRT